MLAALAAVFLPAGCGGAAAELKVYVSYSYWNQDDLRAYQLALREEGDEAGAFKLKIVTLDADVKQIGRPTQASVERNARRAVADKLAIAYLGEGNSGPTVFSMPITNRGGLLQMCPHCTYVGLTRGQGEPGHPERLYSRGRRHFVHIAPADHRQAAALVEYLQQERVERVVILHDGQPYGAGLARFVAQAIPRAGITATGPPQRLRGDIRREARRAVSDGADAIMGVGEFGARLGQVLRRAAKAAPGLLVFSGDSSTNPPFAAAVKDVGHQFRLTGLAIPDGSNRAAAKFVERFTQTYVSAPSPNTYLAYEAMRRLIQAARAAGDRADQRSAIINAMFAAPEENTLVGRYRFDKNGDSTLTGFGAYRIKNGKLSYAGLLRPGRDAPLRVASSPGKG